MNNYLTLTKVLFKANAGSSGRLGKAKRTNYLLLILIGVCFLPIAFTLYSLFDMLFEGFAMIQQTGFVLTLGFFLSCIITFTFSIFLTPAIFYFSKDIETLLYLPLKPIQIIASKFTVLVFYEYGITLIVTVPMLIAYATRVAPDALFYPIAILGLLFLPLLPLVFSSSLIVLVFRFFPKLKNRDAFNLIGSMFSVILALGISFFSQNLSSMTPEQTQELLLNGSNSLMNILGSLFVNIRFFSSALISLNILDLIIYMAISIGFVFIFLFISKFWYFAGAIGVNETSSHRRALSSSSLTKQAEQKSILWTYTRKELRLLVRTPVYFLNCILINFILPIAMLVPLFTKGDSLGQLGTLMSQISYDSFEAMVMVIVIALAGGLLYSNLNCISVTSISREGSNYVFMKYIPVDLMTQLNAKVLSGVVISMISFTMLFVFACIFIQLPLLLALVSYLVAVIGIIVGNYIGILIDLLHPKLVWEQETAAVKQNINSVISILASMAICALLIYGSFVLPTSTLAIILGCLVGAMILFFPILYKLIRRVSTKLFYRL